MRRKPFFGESRMRVYEDFLSQISHVLTGSFEFCPRTKLDVLKTRLRLWCRESALPQQEGCAEKRLNLAQRYQILHPIMPKTRDSTVGYGKMSVPEAISCQLRGYPPGQGARSTVLCYHAVSSSCDIRAFASLPEHTHSP